MQALYAHGRIGQREEAVDLYRKANQPCRAASKRGALPSAAAKDLNVVSEVGLLGYVSSLRRTRGRAGMLTLPSRMQHLRDLPARENIVVIHDQIGANPRLVSLRVGDACRARDAHKPMKVG